MTAQIPDLVLYNGKKYDLSGVDGAGLFDPAGHGIETFSSCTACWRGYQAIYKIEDGKFHLHELNCNTRENPPEINGVKPVEPGEYISFKYQYKDLDLNTGYSGTLVIARDFISSMYVHMGFHGADCYKDVVHFKIKDGVVTEAKDISGDMEKRRQEGRNCKPRSPFEEAGGDGDVEGWVKKRFSRNIK